MTDEPIVGSITQLAGPSTRLDDFFAASAKAEAAVDAVMQWNALAVNFAKAWDAYMAGIRGTEAETLELYKACAAARAAMGPLP